MAGIAQADARCGKKLIEPSTERAEWFDNGPSVFISR